MAGLRLPLRENLILLDDYLHRQFGATAAYGESAFRDLKEKLGDFAEGYDDSGRSYLAYRLITLPTRQLPVAKIEAYDDNIRRHLDAINSFRPIDERITLKYFQHLALFFTEHVLDRYFDDKYAFCADLNLLLQKRLNTVRAYRSFDFDEIKFTPDDLTKLAYWMATGSGKTYLMHLNMLQMRHYLAKSGAKPFGNWLLITPYSDLSKQHEKELTGSGIRWVRFRPGMPNPPAGTIVLIEITKFTENGSGPNTVNVKQFGQRNLLFVDEGHRGASGQQWFKYRDLLARDGFTFEYSATFGEALNKGSSKEDVRRRMDYGKSIVFDYSYRYFHEDGFGKDYEVLNLPKSFREQDSDTLLMGNLLAFYEQVALYRQNQEALRPYHIEHPLLVFVGHTVQTGKTKSQLGKNDKVSLSDVLQICRFLHRVGENKGQWAEKTIETILKEKSGLTDGKGRDIFANRLTTLRDKAAGDVYQEMMTAVFHATTSAPLHLANLKNAPGEISLRIGSTNQPFGVINIGDDSNFLQMASRQNVGLVVDADDVFRGSLFQILDSPLSTINVLVGAKKFTEGWNSWRVSAMGLMNVGKTEGSEIIQMFGRGVRLKGYQFNLKRSDALPGIHPDFLKPLETLAIFSIHGNYLATFREALQREGIIDGWEEIEVRLQYPVWDAESPELYGLRIANGLLFSDQPTFSLPLDGDAVTIDLRPVIQVESSLSDNANQYSADKTIMELPDWVRQLVNWQEIYLEMLVWRRERNLGNMVFSLAQLRRVIEEKKYELIAPASLFDLKSANYRTVRRGQQLVLTILKKYAEAIYRREMKAWEAQHFEYYRVDKDKDSNLRPLALSNGDPGVVVKVARREHQLVQDVQKLVVQGREIYEKSLHLPPTVYFDRHLYQPLLAQGYFTGNTFKKDARFKSSPVGVNKGEVRFVNDMAELLSLQPDLLGDYRLFLLRNLSRGKGIGFFQAANFYPDFILWLVKADEQKITFVDPKGLAHIRRFDHPKIRLYEELQHSIRPSAQPSGISIKLDAYIVAETSFNETAEMFAVNGVRPKREDFRREHILFANENPASELLRRLLA